MRKITAILLVVLIMSFILIGCGKGNTKEIPPLEEVYGSLQEKVPSMTGYAIFDENNDPNGNLGRPGNYIAKGDFSDERVKERDPEFKEEGDISLEGGTLEVFENKKDCQARTDYLQKMSDPSLGALAVNQYMYKYDLALFRVSYDLTASQAEEYQKAMDEILGQESEVVTYE